MVTSILQRNPALRVFETFHSSLFKMKKHSRLSFFFTSFACSTTEQNNYNKIRKINCLIDACAGAKTDKRKNGNAISKIISFCS